jgi:hypothetical protein
VVHRAHSLEWDNLTRVLPALPSLDVLDRCLEQLRTHACHRIFTIPSEPEPVIGLSACGVTAPTLEELNEPRQVDSGAGPHEEVDVRSQESQGHDARMFLNCDPSKVPIEEVAGWAVDHRHAPMGRPGQMEVDLVCRHRGIRWWGRSIRMQREQSPIRWFPLSRVGSISV